MSADAQKLIMYQALCAHYGLDAAGTAMELEKRMLDAGQQIPTIAVPVPLPVIATSNVISIDDSAKKLPLLPTGMAPYRFTFYNQAKADLQGTNATKADIDARCDDLQKAYAKIHPTVTFKKTAARGSSSNSVVVTTTVGNDGKGKGKGKGKAPVAAALACAPMHATMIKCAMKTSDHDKETECENMAHIDAIAKQHPHLILNKAKDLGLKKRKSRADKAKKTNKNKKANKKNKKAKKSNKSSDENSSAEEDSSSEEDDSSDDGSSEDDSSSEEDSSSDEDDSSDDGSSSEDSDSD
jgi:hypothetical protein